MVRDQTNPAGPPLRTLLQPTPI